MAKGKPVCGIIIRVRNEGKNRVKCLDAVVSNEYPKDINFLKDEGVEFVSYKSAMKELKEE